MIKNDHHSSQYSHHNGPGGQYGIWRVGGLDPRWRKVAQSGERAEAGKWKMEWKIVNCTGPRGVSSGREREVILGALLARAEHKDSVPRYLGTQVRVIASNQEARVIELTACAHDCRDGRSVVIRDGTVTEKPTGTHLGASIEPGESMVMRQNQNGQKPPDTEPHQVRRALIRHDTP